MDKYHDEQLYDILSARAKWGLDEDVVTDDQLYRIADAAAGNEKASRERVALAHEEMHQYDSSYYETQLVRAVGIVVSPVG